MTLGVAFLRTVPNRRNRDELVFASDSRFSGGQTWDHGTKIFSLPRSDALLMFAGDTHYAHPLAHQLSTSIAMYPRSADRRFPLAMAKGHLLRVFNQTFGSIYDFPKGQEQPIPAEPPVQFIFGGYAWHDARFRAWHIALDHKKQCFRFQKCGRFFFIGCPPAVKEARERTVKLLRNRPIDMEPFVVLRDIIREQKYPRIGGAPQIAKVYRHMATQFFATLWSGTNSEAVPHVFGRPLLQMETTSWPHFDPDTLHFSATPGRAETGDSAESLGDPEPRDSPESREVPPIARIKVK